jgi:hypothetical protein
MLFNKIITVLTSQDQYAAHKYAAGNTVTTHVNLPRTKAHADGFPVASHHVTVTPSQPCSVHVVNQDELGFDVVMTSLGDTPLVEGQFSVMVVG